VIHVVKPGLLTTVQDLGRYGFAHLGLSPAGAADSLSFRLANFLVGNHPNTPALEITLVGPTLEFDANATLAIFGARTSTSLPLNQAFDVYGGEMLRAYAQRVSAGRAHGHQAVALALVAAAAGVDEEACVAVELHSFAVSLTSAAVRLGALDHAAAQRLLLRARKDGMLATHAQHGNRHTYSPRGPAYPPNVRRHRPCSIV